MSDWLDYIHKFRDHEYCAYATADKHQYAPLRDIAEVSFGDNIEFERNPQKAIFMNIWENVFRQGRTGSLETDAHDALKLLAKNHAPNSREHAVFEKIFAAIASSIYIFGIIPSQCTDLNSDQDLIASYQVFDRKYDYLDRSRKGINLADLALASQEKLRGGFKLFDDPALENNGAEFKKVFVNLFNRVEESKVLKQFRDLQTQQYARSLP